MKHLFIINPVSGGKRHNPYVTEEMIKKAVRGLSDDWEIYFTKAPMDAAEKIKHDADICDELRVYGCGGDGTLCECVNGAVGRKNVAVTQYPCGTGNDFIRLFKDDAERFKSINALIGGQVHTVDTIKCGDMYCLNICSVGTDARVGTDVHKYSRLPFVKGPVAYLVSLVVNVCKGISSPLTVKWDGNVVSDKLTMVCACNGRFYGGGFNPTNDARIEDGKMDIFVVKDVPLYKVPSVLSKYSKGEYKSLGEYITYITPEKIEISADKEFVINVDGEAIYSNRILFELVPASLRFISPKGVKYWNEAEGTGEFESIKEKIGV